MSFTQRRAKPDDVDDMVDVFEAAFANEPINQLVFLRNSQLAREKHRDSFAKGIQDDTGFLVFTDTASSTPDRVVAFAKWVAPDTTTAAATNQKPEDSGEGAAAPSPPPPPPSLPTPQDFPADGDQELGARFFGTMAAGHARIMTSTPHWYLKLLAVHPEYQGRGLAGRFLRWGLERADGAAAAGEEEELGTITTSTTTTAKKTTWPCFLESTPAGKGVYERYGFRVVEQEETMTRLGVAVVTFMIRDEKAN